MSIIGPVWPAQIWTQILKDTSAHDLYRVVVGDLPKLVGQKVRYPKVSSWEKGSFFSIWFTPCKNNTQTLHLHNVPYRTVLSLLDSVHQVQARPGYQKMVERRESYEHFRNWSKQQHQITNSHTYCSVILIILISSINSWNKKAA